MGAYVRLTVPKKSSIFHLQVNKEILRESSLSLVVIVDDQLDSTSSELASLLRVNDLMQK